MNEHYTQLLTSGLGAIAGLLAWMNSRSASKKASDVQTRVQEVHLSMNSRLDEMMRLVRAAAHAEGVAEGTAAEQARVADISATVPATTTTIDGRTDSGAPVP